MDDFFKHRKRKATIVIDSEEVDSESKSNAKSYDKRKALYILLFLNYP